jgi:hypothetical protein
MQNQIHALANQQSEKLDKLCVTVDHTIAAQQNENRSDISVDSIQNQIHVVANQQSENFEKICVTVNSMQNQI